MITLFHSVLFYLIILHAINIQFLYYESQRVAVTIFGFCQASIRIKCGTVIQAALAIRGLIFEVLTIHIKFMENLIPVL